jgi:hypothetical protein
VKSAFIWNIDASARRLLGRRFIFDDDFNGRPNGWALIVAKTADYTVLSTDNDTWFTNQGASGAVNFTLPTVFRGGRFKFSVEANQTVTVTAASGKLVAFNNAAATSIAFSTSSEKIGAMVEIYANADATKWLAQVSLGSETQTPTIA